MGAFHSLLFLRADNPSLIHAVQIAAFFTRLPWNQEGPDCRQVHYTFLMVLPPLFCSVKVTLSRRVDLARFLVEYNRCI